MLTRPMPSPAIELNYSQLNPSPRNEGAAGISRGAWGHGMTPPARFAEFPDDHGQETTPFPSGFLPLDPYPDFMSHKEITGGLEVDTAVS